jgi:hypothetical protein
LLHARALLLQSRLQAALFSFRLRTLLVPRLECALQFGFGLGAGALVCLERGVSLLGFACKRVAHPRLRLQVLQLRLDGL